MNLVELLIKLCLFSMYRGPFPTTTYVPFHMEDISKEIVRNGNSYTEAYSVLLPDASLLTCARSKRGEKHGKEFLSSSCTRRIARFAPDFPIPDQRIVNAEFDKLKTLYGKQQEDIGRKVGILHREESSAGLITYYAHLYDGSYITCVRSPKYEITCSRENTKSDGHVQQSFSAPSNFHTLDRMY